MSEALERLKAHPAVCSVDERPQGYVAWFNPRYLMSGMLSPGKTDAAINALYSRVDSFWSQQRLKLPKV